MEVDAFMEPEMEADTSDIGETYVSNVIAPTEKRIMSIWNLHVMVLLIDADE